MISTLKSVIYTAAQLSGINAVLLRSGWRTQRLLILCYHGLSLFDEHQWSGMYMQAPVFRRRLELLQQHGCNILPLNTALNMLQDGSLPPRSVAITFDDGFYDFYALAWSFLREFGYPVTVYLTTYYSAFNVPVFDPMCGYLLWKARGRQLSWPEMKITPVTLDTRSALTAEERIKDSCREQHLDGRQKHAMLRSLADRLQIDFTDICTRRILHLMNPDEVADLARQGVDFQYHGHRHRVYRSRSRFWNELQENRDAMALSGVKAPAHYCYPTGFWIPELHGWLSEYGIRSAVTCDLGFATRASNPYLLPRLLDTPAITEREFSAWLSGMASWMPRRSYPPDPHQLVEEEPSATEPATTAD